MPGTFCRLCDHPLTQSVVDLGLTPLANSYIKPNALESDEAFFPLHARVCDRCWLVQLPQFQAPQDIFREYAYFSSFSESWVAHAKRYCDSVVERFGLTKKSFVLELASNDGYLLRHFLDQGIPCLGVEPALNVAEVARQNQIPTLDEFFGVPLADRLVAEGKRADLVIANNVLAQVPDLKDFVAGMARMLKPFGVVTAEFPHLLHTLQKNEFDQIYHEHFSYFSLHSIVRAFESQGLEVFDVEELKSHGGSLRVFAQLDGSGEYLVTEAPGRILKEEAAAGLQDVRTYERFRQRVNEAQEGLVEFLKGARERGKSVAGYGAPAKGNTLLNSCGIRSDLLPYTVDRSPHKQGCLLPGSRIPIFGPEHLSETRPDFLLILPWNLSEEIMRQTAFIRDWGGKFVLPIPQLEIL